MKKPVSLKIKRIGALIAAAVIGIFSVPMYAEAVEHRSYTYIYDYWGDVQDCPDVYEVYNVFTSAELGLDLRMNNPSGLTVSGDKVYICDTGNNRIIVLVKDEELGLKYDSIITSVKGAPGSATLSGPTDVAISEDGNMFIADKGNNRILKVDSNRNFIMQFELPVDSALSADTIFLPNKIVVDSAERV